MRTRTHTLRAPSMRLNLTSGISCSASVQDSRALANLAIFIYQNISFFIVVIPYFSMFFEVKSESFISRDTPSVLQSKL